MSGGFALVAWPAQDHVTGVMTFVVNHDGVVREKDLGRGHRRRGPQDDRLQSGCVLASGSDEPTIALVELRRRSANSSGRS